MHEDFQSFRGKFCLILICLQKKWKSYSELPAEWKVENYSFQSFTYIQRMIYGNKTRFDFIALQNTLRQRQI